jgi:hypothetical protein
METGMNNPLKRFSSRLIGRLANAIASHLKSSALHTKHDDDSRLLQILIAQNYNQIIQTNHQIPAFRDAEFSCYSQNGEDGILLLIFSVIGEKTRQVVEVCAGDGIECNAANLIINHGWSGLLFDGNEKEIERGKSFYSQVTNAWRFRHIPPVLVNAWISTENINGLIQQYGFTGDIDLLSLDMDGVDFWIWKSITCISPRVVVLEYNNRWGPEFSVTVPDKTDFVGIGASVEGEGYFGASLSAFKKLAEEKGYRLIGANSPNTNAFFMRNDTGKEHFPEVTVESCLNSDYAKYQQETKYPLIKDMSVIKI